LEAERGARRRLTSFLPGSLALVRDFGPGYRNHRNKMTKAREIVGVRRVQRQFSRDCARAAALPDRAIRPATGATETYKRAMTGDLRLLRAADRAESL